MMRNPLSRKMFANPQQRRQMSRMPSGILASGPNVMRAAMQQEPVKMKNGGYSPPFQLPQGGSGTDILDFINKNILGPNLQIGGSSTQQEGATGTSTSSTSSPKPKPKQVVLGQVTDQPAALNTFSTAVPGEARPDNRTTGNVTRSLKDPNDGNAYKNLITSLSGLQGDTKTTREYVDEAKALLSDYGIEAPDLKSRRDMRIMEFFLNMAAGQSPDAATNIAAAGRESLRGYGDDMREVEKAEQANLLAGLQMGLQKEAREEATEQAIIMKKFDISLEYLKSLENNTPDKIKQVQFLMRDYDMPEADAVKLIFERDIDPGKYGQQFSMYTKQQGLSPALANILAGSPGMLQDVYKQPEIGENILRSIIMAGKTPTDPDFALLQVNKEDFLKKIQVTIQ